MPVTPPALSHREKNPRAITVDTTGDIRTVKLYTIINETRHFNNVVAVHVVPFRTLRLRCILLPPITASSPSPMDP